MPAELWELNQVKSFWFLRANICSTSNILPLYIYMHLHVCSQRICGITLCALCWSSREEIPHIQGKRNPSMTIGTERAQTLKPQSQTTSQSDHRTTALSNSVKPSHAVWGHPRWTGHGGEVWQNVVHRRRKWQTTSVFLPWKPHDQHEKAKR